MKNEKRGFYLVKSRLESYKVPVLVVKNLPTSLEVLKLDWRNFKSWVTLENLCCQVQALENWVAATILNLHEFVNDLLDFHFAELSEEFQKSSCCRRGRFSAILCFWDLSSKGLFWARICQEILRSSRNCKLILMAKYLWNQMLQVGPQKVPNAHSVEI